jgi:mono/diheme cytochrome c family protein
MSANLNIISASTDKLTKTLPFVNGSSGIKDICVSPDGNTVYVSHIVGRYAYPTTQLDRAWINSNCVSIVDTKFQTIICSVLLDEVDKGAANPWGVTVSSDGKYLCVALSGLDEIMLVDRVKMHSRIDDVVNKKSSAFVSSADVIVDYLPFLNNCRERIAVGKGVRAITEKDGILYCGLYFDGRVDAVNLSDKKVTSLSLTSQPEANEVRKGNILWSDATLCYQGWQSCNSCHPDAVVDGFNWDNLNDGLGGGGKNTKSMLYSHRTPPVMSTGIRADAEIAVGAGMKFIQFNTLDEENLIYIDEYLKSLYPVASPYLNKDGTLTESAEAGKALFEQNCASCHPAPLYTDNNLYDVGTKHFSGDSGEYDVPTLNEVWRTAPYMHDGSMNTIEEVVRYFSKNLSDTEVAQISDYVRSIGAEGEYYAAEQIRGTAADGSSFYNKYQSGAVLNALVVRKQSASASDAVATLVIYDKDGEAVHTSDYTVSELSYNESYVITFAEGLKLPDDGSYTISFREYGSDKLLASTLTVK